LSKAETSTRFLYEKVYCARGEMENRIFRLDSSHAPSTLGGPE
jgi:hypothetical protein